MTGTNGKSAKAAGALALALALIVVSCDEEVLPPDAAEMAAPRMRASALSTSVHVDTLPPELFGNAARDSAGSAAGDGEAGGAGGATQGASIVLSERSDVTVDVAFTETAAQNTLRIVEPISQELASGNPISGSFRFGPFEAGTVVAFDLLSGALGRPALQRLSGVGPCWLLEFEDSRDNDFNDLVLLINAVPPGEPKEPTGPGATVRFEPAAVRIETRADGTKVTAEPTQFIVSYRAVTACAEEPVQAEIEIHEARSEVHIGPRLETFHVEGRGELVWDVPVGTPVTPNTSTPRVCLFATYRAPSGFGNEFFTFLRACTEEVEQKPEVRIRAPSGALTVAPAGTGLESTLELEVGVFDASGNPLPNRTVELRLDGIEQSGGHVHGGEMPPGDLSETEVETGPTGIATVRYTAGVFGGLVVMRGTSAEAKEAVDTIRVAVQGLVELLEGGSIDTIGVRAEHPDSHWGTPAFVADLQALADSLQARADSLASLPDSLRPAGRFPRVLGVNDMSLPFGGKFDLNAQYSPCCSHGEHRAGTEADIDVRRGPGDDNLALFIRAIWINRFGHAIGDERETRNHYHLRY
ncbi:MAG TPA: Ig-like domain-containing protein [Longimicrobiales bacterium]